MKNHKNNLQKKRRGFMKDNEMVYFEYELDLLYDYIPDYKTE